MNPVSDQDASNVAGAAAGGIGALVFMLIYFGAILAFIIGMWKVFTKAGKPGWAALVPIYNIMTLAEIGGRPSWWGLLCLVPGVNFIALILISIDVAKSFGKGTGFGIGLAFFGPILWPVLGFGSAQYQGPAQQSA